MEKTIWHISDTHTYHELLQVPEVDIVIHSGDATIPRDKYQNEREMFDFLNWYSTLLIGYKVYVAGNHDISIERGLIKRNDFEDRGIIYLENDYTDIDGLKIFGTPYTPTFGTGWAFNKSRDKMHQIWDNVDEDVDIIVSHGPPKTILDLSYNPVNDLEFCGDLSFKKACILKFKAKLVLFGHIHNCDNITNAGTRQLSYSDTIYSNGSVVTDGKFGRLSSNGNIFKI